MAETIVLDPAAVATSRTALTITDFINVEGLDWGDAAIEAYLADAAIGSSPVDYRLPNRQITIPMKLQTRGATTFDTIRRNLQAKVALFQREGGWVSRQTSVGTMYADVTNASLRMGGSWLQANRGIDVDVVLTLECVPDWYGAEVTLDDKTETTASALVTVLKQSASDAVIAGDYPGRIRIVVDEDDGDTQIGLLGALRSRYYDSATTARIMFEAEALTPLDTAAIGTVTGASGGASNNVLQHTNLRTDWTSILSTLIVSGSAHMTHRGTNRVWARVHTVSSTPPRLRFIWNVGDLVSPSENDPITLPQTGVGNFYWVDLGEVRLDAAPVGTHRWQGELQGQAVSGATGVSIDEIHIVPVDDGYWLLQAPQTVRFLTSYSATDSFTSTTAGNALNARVAPTGGTWTTSGDATDWVFDDDPVPAPGGTVGEHIRRQAISGSAGRFGILGTTNYTDVQVEARIEYEDASGTLDQGVIARWTDSSNYLRASLERVFGSPVVKTLKITQVVAGVETVIATGAWPGGNPGSSSVWWKLRLIAYAGGRLWADVIADSSAASGYGFASGQIMATAQGFSSTLATGGTLATGKVGVWDRVTGTTVGSRYIDDFRAGAAPAFDAVLYANQSCEVRTDGVFREDSAGAAYARLGPIGKLPRIPPSGLESRKVELYLNASRGDFAEVSDTGIDDLSAQVFYRPAWLLVPGS